MLDLIGTTLAIAKEEVGVVEEGPKNWGDRVSQFLKRVGYSKPRPWCAAFVYWSIDEAAAKLKQPNPFIRTGYCPSIHRWAKKQDILLDKPQVGDVFLAYKHFSDPPLLGSLNYMYFSAQISVLDACHIGFVAQVLGAKFYTIEGNTNDDGSADGYGVLEHERDNSDSYKFVRWQNLVMSSASQKRLEYDQE